MILMEVDSMGQEKQIEEMIEFERESVEGKNMFQLMDEIKRDSLAASEAASSSIEQRLALVQNAELEKKLAEGTPKFNAETAFYKAASQAAQAQTETFRHALADVRRVLSVHQRDFNARVAEEVNRINGEKHASYNDEMERAHAETEAYRGALREIANRADIAVESLDTEYCREAPQPCECDLSVGFLCNKHGLKREEYLAIQTD